MHSLRERIVIGFNANGDHLFEGILNSYGHIIVQKLRQRPLFLQLHLQAIEENEPSFAGMYSDGTVIYNISRILLVC